MAKSFAVFLQEAGRPRQAKFDADAMKAELKAASKDKDKVRELIKGYKNHPAAKNKIVWDQLKAAASEYGVSDLFPRGRGAKQEGDEDDDKNENVRDYVLLATVTLENKIAKAKRELKGISPDEAKQKAKEWQKELYKKFPNAEDVEVDIEDSDGEKLTFKVDPHGREDADEHSISR